MSDFKFTFALLEEQYRHAQDSGYSFITCNEFLQYDKASGRKTIVHRVDIDFSVKKAGRLLEIFNRLKIKATFFVRLHAPEYNPFSFENYRILKAIKDSGHEIGYHSEIVDQAAIWQEDAADCLIRDISILNQMLGINVCGVASHGGMTGLNNLDFWNQHSPEQFGLSYEAYEKSDKFNLFSDSFYVSDSEWTRWKCYKNGVLCVDDRRSLAEHVSDDHSLIYLLIHSDTYFDNHFYE